MGINIQEGWYDPNLLLLARFVTIAVHGSGSTVIPNCLYPCSALAACVCSLGHLQQWRLLQGPARKGPVLKPGLHRKMRRAGPRLRSCPYLTLPNKQVPLGLYPTVQRQGGLDCRGDRGRGHGVKRAARLGTPVTNAALSS